MSPTFSLRSVFCVTGLIAATLFPSQPRLAAATPLGISLLKTVDLAPGADAYFPFQFGTNHLTHKLYVVGSNTAEGEFTATQGSSGFGIKVIDMTSNRAVAGVALGFYDQGTTEEAAFQPLAITVDESPAPDGNKIYVLGSVGDDRLFLRTIDGVTDTSETEQATDLLLPVESSSYGYYLAITVNPANHKVYVSNEDADVVVIDGPNRQVLTTLSLFGFYLEHFLVANPVANKVLFFDGSGIKIIDGVDESVTSVNTDYTVLDGVFDPVSGRVFLAAQDSSLYPMLIAIDGVTGATIASKTGLPERSQSIAVDGLGSRVYIGAPSESVSGIISGRIASFSSTNLSATDTYDVGASRLSFDGAGADARVYLLDYDYSLQAPALRNSVGVLNPATAEIDKVTVGYNPGRIAFNPKTGRIYIADLKAPEVVVLDATTHDVIARRAIPPRESSAPYEHVRGFRPIVVSVALNRFYVTHSELEPATGLETGYIDEFDGETNEPLQSIFVNKDRLATWPQIAIDDTRGRLFAHGIMLEPSFGSFVNVYDAVDRSLLATITSGIFSTNDITANPVTGYVYLSGGISAAIIDPLDFTVTGGVPAGGVPGVMAVNTKTNRTFIVDQTGNAVTVIDGDAIAKEATISNAIPNPGDAVRSVAVDDVTNTVFLGCYSVDPARKGYVSIFDGNNDYVYRGQIDVGQFPERMAFDTATRQLLVSNNEEGTISVLQSSTPAPPDRLANLSTRLEVEGGENVLIGGFIVTGPAGSTKQVLIRGIGPSLAAAGFAGSLADPYLDLYGGANIIASNDNWKFAIGGQSQQAAIEGTTIPPTDDLESAILVNLTPGSYTAVLRGTNVGAGIGLVEIYDLTASTTTKMVNISTRGKVNSGDNVMIGGLILTGANPSRLILRALGPSLSETGVSGALQDPVLELYNTQGVLITTNDDWKEEQQTEIQATGVPPSDDRESAIVATLYPSNYTAIVRGKDNTSGVGLIEAYYLP